MTKTRKPTRHERAIRRVQREIRWAKRSDWDGKTIAGNTERDRYVQGLSSALAIMRRK